MSGLAGVTQTTGGKIGVAVLVIAALGAVVFELVGYQSSQGSRNVTAKEVVSESQQQIDAVNKMTNLSPEAKQAIIAHEQGEINAAQGSMRGGRGIPPGQPGTTH